MGDCLAVCYKCGKTEADTWRWCSVKADYVCKECCCNCVDYSETLLSNGIHCKAIWRRQVDEDKLMGVRFLCLPDEVAKAKKFYIKRDPESWMETLREAVEKYNGLDDPERRALGRAHITALQELIREGRRKEC